MTRYIWTLAASERFAIAMALINAGIGGDDFERAMGGRICDLEDTIDISEWKE